MLAVGLVGLGSDWESQQRPALNRLRHRLRVRGIYTAVASRADPVAEEFECVPCASLRMMAERSDLHALLVFDPGWKSDLPAQMAGQAGKAAFYLPAASLTSGAVQRLADLATQANVTLTPGLTWRYLPATLRLRELLATQLSKPHQIEMRLRPLSDLNANDRARMTARPIEALDWCHFIAGTPCIDQRWDIEQQSDRGESDPLRSQHRPIQPDAPAPAAEGISPPDAEFWQRTFCFRAPASGGPAPVVKIMAPPAVWQVPHTICAVESLSLQTVHGRARLLAADQIAWSCGAEAEQQESLSEERSPIELLLDHFSRRVVGGLVSLPTFDDLAQAWRIWNTCELPGAVDS